MPKSEQIHTEQTPSRANLKCRQTWRQALYLAVSVLSIALAACSGAPTSADVTPTPKPAASMPIPALTATPQAEQQSPRLPEIAGTYSLLIQQNNLTSHDLVNMSKLERLKITAAYLKSSAQALKNNPQFDDVDLNTFHAGPRSSLSQYLTEIADGISDAVATNRTQETESPSRIFWQDDKGNLNINLRYIYDYNSQDTLCCTEKNGQRYVVSEVELAMDIIANYYNNVSIGELIDTYHGNANIDWTFYWISFRFFDKLNQMNDNSRHFPGTAWYDAVNAQELAARQKIYVKKNHIGAFYKFYLDTARNDAQNQDWVAGWDDDLFRIKSEAKEKYQQILATMTNYLEGLRPEIDSGKNSLRGHYPAGNPEYEQFLRQKGLNGDYRQDSEQYNNYIAGMMKRTEPFIVLEPSQDMLDYTIRKIRHYGCGCFVIEKSSGTDCNDQNGKYGISISYKDGYAAAFSSYVEVRHYLHDNGYTESQKLEEEFTAKPDFFNKLPVGTVLLIHNPEIVPSGTEEDDYHAAMIFSYQGKKVLIPKYGLEGPVEMDFSFNNVLSVYQASPSEEQHIMFFLPPSVEFP